VLVRISHNFPSFMKTPIHVQLRHSLLFETIGGGYQPGQRFLSNRKICRKWCVSDTTTRKALAWMVEEGIVQARAQSGFYLNPDYHKRALLLLHKHTRHKLPSPPSLATRRFQYLPGAGRKRRRIALVWYDDEPSTGVGRLPPKMLATGWDWSHGFFTEAVAHGCEVHFFVLNRRPEQQQFALAKIVEARLDGVAVFSRVQDPGLPPLLSGLTRGNIPVIRVFGDSEGLELPTVNLNNVAMGYEGARRLARLGHRRLVVLIDAARRPTSSNGWRGFVWPWPIMSREESWRSCACNRMQRHA
jgi:DNA-binding transcriptional regulator YhcF (GntR family)